MCSDQFKKKVVNFSFRHADVFDSSLVGVRLNDEDHSRARHAAAAAAADPFSRVYTRLELSYLLRYHAYTVRKLDRCNCQ